MERESGKQILVGICAMAKKSNSKPMKVILARLEEFEYIKTIIFPEETILKVVKHDTVLILWWNNFVDYICIFL